MNYSLISRTAAGALLVAALAACGGGSPATDAAAPTTFTVAGTAATGAAFAGATVTLVDSTGAVFAADAVTAADGNYSVTVPLSAKPPFVVQPVSADKSVTLVSVVAEAKTTTTNITPITNLIASRLSPSGDPTKLAGELKAGTASFDTAALAVKVAEIVALIQPLRDAAGDTSDPLNGKLVADGTGADKVLDSLTITITPSSASAVDIVVTVKPQAGDTASTAPISFAGGGTNSPIVATVSVPSGTPFVPADFALTPAASNCSALHSGTYRVVMPILNTTSNQSSAAAELYGKMVVDAATLAVIDTDGKPATWTADGPCQFTDDNGKTVMVVSQAGVIVSRYTNDSGITYKIGLGFPDQTHTLAELAGNWNTLGMRYSGSGTAYTGTASSLTMDAAGALSAVNFCQDNTAWSVTGGACTNLTDGTLSMTSNADGGFDFMKSGAAAGRVFGYRAGGGELMLVKLDPDGGFSIYSKQRTLTLPTVGAVSTTWSVFLGNQLVSGSPIGATRSTIVSVDTAANSYLRSAASNATFTNDHPETLLLNNPRNGYSHRDQGSAPASDGTTASISEFNSLAMRGMGFSPLLLPGAKLFLFAVGQP